MIKESKVQELYRLLEQIEKSIEHNLKDIKELEINNFNDEEKYNTAKKRLENLLAFENAYFKKLSGNKDYFMTIMDKVKPNNFNDNIFSLLLCLDRSKSLWKIRSYLKMYTMYVDFCFEMDILNAKDEEQKQNSSLLKMKNIFFQDFLEASILIISKYTNNLGNDEFLKRLKYNVIYLNDNVLNNYLINNFQNPIIFGYSIPYFASKITTDDMEKSYYYKYISKINVDVLTHFLPYIHEQDSKSVLVKENYESFIMGTIMARTSLLFMDYSSKLDLLEQYDELIDLESGQDYDMAMLEHAENLVRDSLTDEELIFISQKIDKKKMN